MTSNDEAPEAAPALRGQQAWKAAMDKVAERNEQARNTARQVRQARAKQADAARHEADRKDVRSVADSANRVRKGGGGARSYQHPSRG
jgi:hypothetical protein